MKMKEISNEMIEELKRREVTSDCKNFYSVLCDFSYYTKQELLELLFEDASLGKFSPLNTSFWNVYDIIKHNVREKLIESAMKGIED